MAVARRLLGLAFAVFRVCYNFNVENKTPVYKRKKGISDQKGVPEKKKNVYFSIYSIPSTKHSTEIFLSENIWFTVLC